MPESLIHILLVEDDEVDVMNVKRAFKKNHILNPLHIANDGLAAFELLRGEHKLSPTPFIILLDINMPKMNGIEFLQQLRQDPSLRHITVFIMTTSDEEQDKIAAYNLNVAGYILKPIKFEDFLAKVATLDKYWKLCEYPESLEG